MNTSLKMDLKGQDFTYPTELEKYEHSGVIGKFKDEWDVDTQEAKEIFEEMKKFLYISALAQKNCIEFEIDEPILMIDKMWHHFIMFTLDYENFCKSFFGKMLHHIPFCTEHLTQKIKELSSKGETLNEYKSRRLQRQLETIQEVFGTETVKKWYVDYSHRYSPERMNMLQRSIYHGDLDRLGSPIDLETVKKSDAKELIQGILRHQSQSMFCGGHGCGVYCSCNSGSLYS
ncbi:hypothetical protein SAMN05216588_11015 [Pseudomonas flavescens]|uniref:Uncharacterized protein n=1 Tax=Phytopseudomonas flavescens TaxID=29435 RepID=A0A1G8H1F8_9GAMM|nr:hypothetical protein [Pseudomonas flavescens]SDI00498.1 hypothetical protein SAMN05216588_11015 [Pseudomonas flavescens]